VFYNQESAKFIPSLEAKLSNNPKSPTFARLASYYLIEGNAQKAVDVCVAGLRFFPNYATAHLILGRAYEALGRTVEAMIEFRKVHRAVPENETVGTLLNSVERREQEAFKAFAEERANKLRERRNTLTLEAYAHQEQSSNEHTGDFLLQRLHESRRAAPPQPSITRPIDGDEDRSAQPTVPKIVTATLAEIYANQGEYREAIEAYRKLRAQLPDSAERFDKRIHELEGKLQHSEQRL